MSKNKKLIDELKSQELLNKKAVNRQNETSQIIVINSTKTEPETTSMTPGSKIL